MAFCNAASWNMTLVLLKAPTQSETFSFILQEDGTGVVNLATLSNPTKLSDLRWACRPLGASGQSGARGYMSFVFRFRRLMGSNIVEMGVVLSGFAHQTTEGATIFDGNLITFPIKSGDDTPAGGAGVLATLAPDPGDTGTGNGMQT